MGLISNFPEGLVAVVWRRHEISTKLSGLMQIAILNYPVYVEI